MQHPDLAVQQLENGIKKLGLRGMSVGGSVEGLELADPKFHPIWAKAEELGCDLIVKGAYTQSRLRQMIFGGATRHIIMEAKIPVLMAH